MEEYDHKVKNFTHEIERLSSRLKDESTSKEQL